ncbi:MAG: NlpBDapX lipoprotein [Gallionellales bacterium RIFCSPLOWO2_02_FULL_57_47]|nr:MAG: NlpBDapX lipoprotein [Gallionellales bacterium RIFCSPLOWO2_02_FULL_57_47]OGT13894.1 MAG: NlpBDapX lipoprotein [Gallionellales bacterium RIFCSPHIGHO2_02_FULL_57_16]
MKVLQIVISGVVLVSLAGCSAIGPDRRVDYGAGAKQLPNLEVPPDLTAPGSDERYKLPQDDAGTVATFSDYSKGGIARGGDAGAVLPAVPGVRLERNGAQRWLVVKDSPENVWSAVKAFLLELGLTIKSEEQAAGVMETDWAENRAKIPQSTIRNVIGKVFDKANTPGERDQYLARLERGKDGESTEVYITHRGMAQALAADTNTLQWQLRVNEPELEAIMLQRLMVRFGAGEDQAASAVAAASAAPVVPEPAGTASLREVPDGGVIIAMNDAFDRSWRKVGLAIESAGLAVEDRNREKGIYFLRPVKVERSWLDKLMFWKSSEDTEHQYRVNVKDGGAMCEVSVTDQNGASSTVTKQMVEAIYKHINQ